jgi:hypothetical protein
MNSGKSFTLASNNQSDNFSKVIDQVFTCTNEHLRPLINQMVKTADLKLSEQADKAETEEETMKYINCTRILCTDKNDVSHHFFNNLNKSLTITKNNDSDDQSLVDHDEMEEMVAITTMHAKALNIYGREVHNLGVRMEYLEIMCEDIFDKDVLDPKRICEIFQKTIEGLEIAIEAKLIFYKSFDEEVCTKLGVMYRGINQIFIDNDIMPEIHMKTINYEELEYLEEDVSAQVVTYYDPTENAVTDFIPRTKEDISRIVNQFMSGDMTISSDQIDLPESFLRMPTQQDLEGENCFERKEVLKALSKLQYKLTSLQNSGNRLSTKQIKQEILADISKEHGGIVDKEVNILDERNIDFIGMMFDAISKDKTVSKLMSSLIHQLKVPVMKIAMSDKKLFEDDDHPARVTVDLLIKAGKGINQHEDRLYCELEDIVNNILNEFDSDLGAVEKAADKLKAIIYKEERLTTETESKQKKKILHDNAQNIVVKHLKMLYFNRKIPGKIKPLILKHWATLMLTQYIHHGRSSNQWLQSVLLLKLLLKCIQPIRGRSQFNMVKNNHLALVEAVSDELYQTQQNHIEICHQITQLKSYFTQLIDGYDISPADDASDLSHTESIEEPVEDSDEELQKIQQQACQAKQKIAKLSEHTKPGVWFEVYNGKDRAVRRLKLSVILNDTAELIFVDRKGVKVLEKDAEIFAKEMEENRSCVLADHSTFDYAFSITYSIMNEFSGGWLEHLYFILLVEQVEILGIFLFYRVFYRSVISIPA